MLDGSVVFFLGKVVSPFGVIGEYYSEMK